MNESAPDETVLGATPLFIKKGKERRLRTGHPWIFSNEIDTGRSPLKGLEPGELVEIRNSTRQPLGLGYVNPRTLISVRLMSREFAVPIDRSLVLRRIQAALAHRERYFSTPFYRLVYGESDGLPGLIVDRYGDVVVAQLTTAGMERMREWVVDALVEALAPSCVFLKNESGSRELEGLDTYSDVVHGALPDAIAYEENGARFEISPGTGQKTGWFFDHRANRQRLLRYVAGKRVLDLFSYTGAWGVQAAVAGAAEVTCVDSSAPALAQAEHHAGLNGVSDRMQFKKGDVFDVLRDLRAANEQFDVIIADPPAFIRRRKDNDKGFEAYRRVNGLSMQLLRDDGLLVSASCSFHLSREKLGEIIARVSGPLPRRAMIVEEGHQDVDHPVHPALVETSYLKALFVRMAPES